MPVRHFSLQQHKHQQSMDKTEEQSVVLYTLWIGFNSKSTPIVQKYIQKSIVNNNNNNINNPINNSSFELVGEANVGDDVWCVVPLSRS